MNTKQQESPPKSNSDNIDASSLSPSLSNTTPAIPSVVNDAQYQKGRQIITRLSKNDNDSHDVEGAIEIFASLVKDAKHNYGEQSLNAAAVYYEYGNALFRNFLIDDDDDDNNIRNDDEKEDHLKYHENEIETDDNNDKHERDQDENSCGDEEDEESDNENSVLDTGNSNENNHEMDDIHLALECMENAWSILDEYLLQNSTTTDPSTTDTNDKSIHDSTTLKDKNKNPNIHRKEIIFQDSSYLPWVKDQLPRMLLGIGEINCKLERFGDALTTYSKALLYREESIKEWDVTMKLCKSERKSNKTYNESCYLESIKRHRLLMEVCVLITETLLACPDGDNICKHNEDDDESKIVLVKDSEKLNFVNVYYDYAKDELDKTVTLMKKVSKEQLCSEMEDIRCLYTILKGIEKRLIDLDKKETKSSTQSKKKRKLNLDDFF